MQKLTILMLLVSLGCCADAQKHESKASAAYSVIARQMSLDNHQIKVTWSGANQQDQVQSAQLDSNGNWLAWYNTGSPVNDGQFTDVNVAVKAVMKYRIKNTSGDLSDESNPVFNAWPRDYVTRH